MNGKEIIDLINEAYEKTCEPEGKTVVIFMGETTFKYAEENNLIIYNEFNKPFIKSSTSYDLIPVVINKSVTPENIDAQKVEDRLNKLSKTKTR